MPNASLTLSTACAASLRRRRVAKPILWPTIAATSFGFALVQLDVSIVNVALARISDSLGGEVAGLQWIIDSHAIAFASLLLAAGSLGDRFGARPAYIGGLTLFMIASVACGIAPGTGTLIAARALQGVAAALVVPCSLALLTHACGDDGAARARAISLWTAAGSVTLSAGPLLGGVLVDALGWRSIFLVNIPIGAAGIWWTWRTIAETPRRDGALDLPGQALAMLMLLALTGAIIEAGHRGMNAPLVIAGFVGAPLCGAGFLWREARTADPMVPLGFFRNPTFRYRDAGRSGDQPDAVRDDLPARALSATDPRLFARDRRFRLPAAPGRYWGWPMLPQAQSDADSVCAFRWRSA